MKNKFKLLKADVQLELDKLHNLEKELESILSFPTKKPSSVELRAIGGILHDFYSGVEKIFKRIALEIDGEIPRGEDWHIHLLDRMAIRVPQVRPDVISNHIRNNLEDYLRFRHLFRHLYGFELKWSRCQVLALNMPDTLNHFSRELEKFLKFLESLSEGDKKEKVQDEDNT